MSWGSLLFLLACGTAPTPTLPSDSDSISVRTWIEGGKNDGVLVVQTTYDSAGEVTLPKAPVDPNSAMTFQAQGAPQEERVGAREVVTQRWKWSAPKGNYEIPALVGHWKGPDQELDASSSPLFVDVQTDPLGREGELADIGEPGRIRSIPWRAIGVGGGVAVLLLGGVFVAFRAGQRRGIPQVPPEPPDAIAIRQWDAVRHDPALDDYQRALEISRIFRTYVEAVLGFPATAWTTSEILGRLGDLSHLPEGNTPRAKRLLRATDRVKFAGDQARAELFEELDSDLRAFVGSTRPHQWRPE